MKEERLELDFSEDIKFIENPADTLQRLKTLCDILDKQEIAVKEAEDNLKAAKKAFDKTRMEDLPELMIEVGMTKLVTENGDTIELKEEVSTSITQAHKPAALSWLQAHNFGGIIKTKVISEFGKDERDEALSCAQDLMNKHFKVTFDESVHPATLKSFIKERLAAGDEIPMDLFSVHPYNVATIKRGK